MLSPFKSRYSALLLVMAGLPSASNAGTYYFSTFTATNINVYAQYTKALVGGGTELVWARPASDDSGTHQATFTSSANASYFPTVGPSQNSNPTIVTKTITTHVPPAGTFPISTQEAFININGATNPGQDQYGQSNGYEGPTPYPDLNNTSFTRSDSNIDNLGAVVNPFGVLESAGEKFQTVAEGSLFEHGIVQSTATAQFSGWADLSDKTFDAASLPSGAPGGPPTPYDGANNLGWTGLVKLSFDYSGQLQLRTDHADDYAQANYSFQTQFFDSNGGIVAAATQNPGIPLNAPLSNSNTVNAGGDFNFVVPSTHYEYTWNLAGTSVWPGYPVYPTAPNILNFQISVAQNVFGTARDFTEVPEPASIFLMGAGLMGLKRFGSRKSI